MADPKTRKNLKTSPTYKKNRNMNLRLVVDP